MNLSDKIDYIWLDGEFIPSKDANVHALSHTLHYGVGVFEGVRVYDTSDGPAIFRLNDHTDRLFRSARMMNIKIPYSKKQLNDVQKEITLKNKFDSAYLRPVVFYGAEHLNLYPKGLSVHVGIAAWEWENYFDVSNSETGINVHISSYRKNHIESGLCKAKTNGNYVNSILALLEAREKGCEEALLLDTRGFVSEGSSANVFIVRNSILYTPPTTSILEGITRDTIMMIANDLGINVIEKELTRDDVYSSDEMFFTGTAAEITSVKSVDGRKIGDGSSEKITKTLQEFYFNLVHGKCHQYSHWVTYLNEKA